MINVNSVSFSYPRATEPAVQKLSFSVEPGQIFGLLGPSGAGKSTTQKILIGLLKGYAGGITVLGKDLREWKGDYYERVGVSFELPNHFLKLRAVENLAYFSALYSRPTHEPRMVLDRVGLGADADLLVSQYSKGMKNRLNLARALLHNPDLLFLDEPTSGLDPSTKSRIKNLIVEQRREGKTIFLTTHDMALAEELCDHVAFMIDGEIKLIDTPRSLKLRFGAPRVRVEYQSTEHPERAEFALDGLGDNNTFLGLLRGGGVQTIHTQEATLEDIFIRVTGRSIL